MPVHAYVHEYPVLVQSCNPVILHEYAVPYVVLRSTQACRSRVGLSTGTSRGICMKQPGEAM
eukprot:363835-Chlamydomonas_euryale.AAC.6